MKDYKTLAAKVPIPASSPPVQPKTVKWKCHGCGSVWGFNITNRCLKCGHTVCFRKSAPKKPLPERLSELDRFLFIKHRRKTRVRAPCIVRYSPHDWEKFNAWRRERTEYEADPAAWRAAVENNIQRVDKAISKVPGRKSDTLRLELAEQRRQYVRNKARRRRLEKGTHDCGTDCDRIGECRDARWQMSSAFDLDKRWEADVAKTLAQMDDEDSTSEAEEEEETSCGETYDESQAEDETAVKDDIPDSPRSPPDDDVEDEDDAAESPCQDEESKEDVV